jgi:transposase-like protein
MSGEDGRARGAKRSRAKERFWREHVARQAAGGLSVREYCRRHGITEPSFYAWRRKLAVRNQAKSPSTAGAQPSGDPANDGAKRAAGVEFLQVDLRPEASCPGATVELLLPGELRLLVHAGATRALLREVLAALGVAPEEGAQPC